jgi:hypothetical protein
MSDVPRGAEDQKEKYTAVFRGVGVELVSVGQFSKSFKCGHIAPRKYVAIVAGNRRVFDFSSINECPLCFSDLKGSV